MSKILVVDDISLARNSLKLILESEGHEVVGEASSGLDAVRKFKQLKPDIVFMDITMPLMDGITALRKIKLIDIHAKIIMCTSIHEKESILAALRSGASDYVIKPIDKDRIVKSIECKPRCIAGVV